MDELSIPNTGETESAPIEVGFGDVIQPVGESNHNSWGDRCVVIDMIGNTIFTSAIVEEDGKAVLIGHGTFWGPLKPTGESWTLDQVYEAIAARWPTEGRAALLEILTESSKKEPVLYDNQKAKDR